MREVFSPAAFPAGNLEESPALSPPDQLTVKVAGSKGDSAATVLVGAAASTVVLAWAAVGVVCRLPTLSVATV